MTTSILTDHANASNEVQRHVPIRNVLLEAEKLTELGKENEAIEMLARGGEFELAINRIKKEIKKENDVGKRTEMSARIEEYCKMGIVKYEKEGLYKMAGKLALEMSDEYLALALFEKGFWFADARDLASMMGLTEKAKEYGEKAKLSRVPLMEEAGLLKPVKRGSAEEARITTMMDETGWFKPMKSL